MNSGISSSVLQLLRCCPHLETNWQRERIDRMDDDPEFPLDYMQTAALAQVVVDAYVANDRACLPGLFTVLEELLTTLPVEDRDLLIVGFLEDLQGAIGWAKLDPAEFYAWLGPRSRRRWDELNRYWADIQRWKATEPSNSSFKPADIEDPKLRKMLKGLYRPPKDPASESDE
jgi:hypothetical protein